MRVVFNTAFEHGLKSINQAAEALTEAHRQVASGRRIARPSQDPLGMGTAIHEHANLDRLDASSNATESSAYRLTVADNTLSDIITQLTAAQSTALSARGSSQTQAQRDAASNQLLAIRDALMSDANTKFQGTYLFSGSQVTTAPFAQRRRDLGVSGRQQRHERRGRAGQNGREHVRRRPDFQGQRSAAYSRRLDHPGGRCQRGQPGRHRGRR